jgi:murein DD-endopeptidase MepM/ murein hydrolase activator NlpD
LSFGDLQNFFRPKAEASISQNHSPSVQSMPVLEASVSPNPAKGGGDVTIVDGEAVVPEEGPAGTMADIVKPKNNQIAIYIVKEGDTISQIAQLFGVSVNTIKWGNDISPKGTIRVGQTLTILPVTGVKYTTKKGDTLASVAKQFGGSAEEIASFNGIDGNLAAGTPIIIPDGEIAAPKVAAVKKSSAIGAEPAHNVGPVGTAAQNAYYIAPLAHYVETQGVHGYNGVDLAAPAGSPILASATGDVIVAKNNGGYNGGYGNYIVIQHDNGSQTLYGHASSVIVSVGQHVVQGQVIGYEGATGKATGPHVHFEIRGGPRNPF